MIFKCLGAGLFIVTAVIVWHCLSPFGWATTEGKVNAARVVEGTRDTQPYHLSLSYSYNINGKTHTGQGFLGYGHPGIANTDAQRFLSGSPLNVFYDPGNPDNSMLAGERNSNLQRMFLFIFTAAVLVISIYKWIIKAPNEARALEALRPEKPMQE